MKIDVNNSVPKYLQLKEIIIRYFHEKQYDTDQKFLPETEINGPIQGLVGIPSGRLWQSWSMQVSFIKNMAAAVFLWQN